MCSPVVTLAGVTTFADGVVSLLVAWRRLSRGVDEVGDLFDGGGSAGGRILSRTSGVTKLP